MSRKPVNSGQREPGPGTSRRALQHALQTFSSSGDVEPLRAILAPDVVWHNPGENSLSGSYRGPAEVAALMNRMKAETQGTLSLQVQGTCVVDGMIVVVARATGRRNGKSLEQDLITTYRLNRDGKIRERRVFLEDSGSNDEFWS